MSWIKCKEVKFFLLTITVLLLTAELVSYAAYFHTKKSGFGLYALAVKVNKLLNSEETLLSKIRSSRLKNKDTYPWYRFEPMRHDVDHLYFLGNVSKSKIVYCNESKYWAEFSSDEIGFRNPLRQLGREVDYAFLGDSWAEGACENEAGTIAGFFRHKGYSVFNLGRGHTGPLFQLATAREYLFLNKPKEVIWFVFGGNDLKNLQEERISKLLHYYVDQSYTQSLYENRLVIDSAIKRFLDEGIKANKPIIHSDYGEFLDAYSAKLIEGPLLIEVAKKIKIEVEANGARLRTVFLPNPYAYNDEIEEITLDFIEEFSLQNDVPLLAISRESLFEDRLFLPGGGHPNANGYKFIAQRVLDWLKRIEDDRVVRQPKEV